MKLLRILVFLSFAMAAILVVPENFSTIQEGIDSASEEDTVIVSEGIYYENFKRIRSSFTIRCVPESSR